MSDLTDSPLTIPAGTQVVARVAVRDEAGVELAPAAVVGIVVARPTELRAPTSCDCPTGARWPCAASSSTSARPTSADEALIVLSAADTGEAYA